MARIKAMFYLPLADNDGRDLSQLRSAPWTSLSPGLAIGMAVLGFNLLGDALRDALDPRGVTERAR